MSNTQQLNIRRPKAAEAARELAAAMGVPISQAVELCLASTKARLQEHIERGGHPDRFRATLIEEGIERRE